MPNLVNLEDPSWYKSAAPQPAQAGLVDLEDDTWLNRTTGGPRPDPLQPDADPEWDQKPVVAPVRPENLFTPRTVCVNQNMSEKVKLLDDIGAHFLAYRGKDIDAAGQTRLDDLWRGMRDTLDKNGVRTAASDKTIWKLASERLNNELGPMWADTLNPGDTGRILGTAVLAETIAHASLNSVDGVDGYATEKWTMKQSAGAMKLPGAVAGLSPEQFAAECRDLEHLWAARKGFTNSIIHVVGNAIGAVRDLDPYRQSLLDKYYVAVTGQSPSGVSNRDKATAIEPWQEAVTSARAQARKSEMYRRAGFDVGPENLDKNGNMPLTAFAPAAESLNRYYVMQQQGVSYVNPDKMADYRTVRRLKDELNTNPVQFISRVLGGADAWSSPAHSMMRAALEGEQDPEMRWRTFAEMADSAHLRAAVQPGYQAMYKKYHTEERTTHDQRLLEAQRMSEDMNHRDMNRSLTDGFIQQRNAVKHEEDARAAAQESSFLVKLAFAVPHALGTFIHKTGLGKIDEALTPVNHWLLNEVFDPDPVRGVIPEGHMPTEGLFQKRYHSLGRALVDNVWLGKIDEAAYSRYMTRKRAGQTSIGDELSVLGFSMWDMFSDLPGMVVDQPATAAAMMYLGGKVAKGRHALVSKAVDAGLPRPLVAAVQAVLEPDKITDAVSTLLGTNVAQVRHYGLDARRLRSIMKAHPEQAPHMVKLIDQLDRVFNNTTTPGMVGNNIQAYSAAVSALWHKVESGKVPSWVEVNRALKMGMDVSPELSAYMAAPPTAIKPGPVRDAMFARRLVEDDLRYISEFEKGVLGSDPNFAASLDKPISHYMVEAHNAYRAGKLNQFLSQTTQRMASTLKASPATVQKVGEFFSRHVPQLDKFDHLATTWSNATAAWKSSMEQAGGLTDVLGICGKHQQVLMHHLASDIYLTQNKINTIKGLPAAEQAKHQAVLEASTTRLKQLQSTMEARRVLVNKVGLHSDILSHKMDQQMYRGAGQEGIEVGHKTTFTPQERAQLAEPLVDLVSKLSNRAEQFGVPRAIIQAVEGAEARLPKSLKDALAQSKADLAAMDPFSPKIGEAVARHKGLEAQVRNVLINAAAAPKHWNVQALNDIYTNSIQGTRGRVQNMMRDLASQAGPTFMVLDLMRTTKYPLLKNASAGHIAARSEAAGSVLHSALNRAQEMYDELPREVQRIHDKAWNDPLSLTKAEQSQLVSELMVREKAVRHAVLDAAVRTGKLDPAKAAEMKAGTYNERYYVEHQFSRELRDMGYQVESGGGGLPPARPAKFSALKAQRSATEVRQFYVDPATGKMRELSGQFTLKKYGSPEAALKAAEEWAQVQIESGKLLPEHIRAPEPIITDAEFANLGVIGPTGTFRFDRVRELINDSQRYDMFRTYAQMGGMSRSSLSQIPENRRAEWSAQPLRGKEWGDLEGKYIHNSLYQHMNAWDSYSHVMEGVFASMQEQIGRTWDLDKLSNFEKLLSPKTHGTEKGILAPVRRAVKSWQHNLIIKSVETHIANHMTNLTTMPLIGVNPFRRSSIESFQEYGRIADDIAAGDLTRLGKADAADFRYMHERGLLGATVGTTSSKLASDMSKVGLGRVDKVFENVRKHGQATLNKQLRRVEHIENAIDVIKDRLDQHNIKPFLSGAEQAKLMAQQEKFTALLKMEQKKVPTQFMQHPLLQLGEDAARSLFDADRSVIAQHLSAHYAAIDPAYKYMAFKELRRKGLSQAEAYQTVSDYMQNYNMVPPSIRALKKHSTLGAMVPSFPYEMGRIMKNLVTKAPGKALAYAGAVPAFNMATLTSHGLSINDLKQQLGADSDYEVFVDLMTNMYVPTDSGMHRIGVGKYGLISGLMRSGGLLSPVIQGRLIPSLENHFGVGAAAVGGAAMNYLSQFVANTPLGNIFAKRVLGVDPFTKELTFGAGEGATGIFQGIVSDLYGLSTPRTLVSTQEAIDKVGPPSIVTGFRKTWLEAIISGSIGFNMSHYNKSEALARMAISYSRANQLDEVFQEMKSDRRREFERTAAGAKLALDEGDTEEYNRLFDEALAISKEASQGQKKYIAGRQQEVSKTDRALEARLTEYIGRNVYQTIERVPIDLAPSFALDAWTSGWVDKHGPEMQHIWRQLQDPEYMSGQRDPELLAKAINKTTELSALVKDEELRANLDRSAQVLGVQFLRSAIAEAQADSPGELLIKLLKSKKGAQAAALQRVIRAGQ